MLKKRLLIGMAAAGLVLLSACGGSGGAGGPYKTETNESEILLPFPEGLPLFPTIVGAENGYFADNDINPKISVADGSGFVSQQLVSGNVNFALMSSADIVVSASKRDDIRVLFCHQVHGVYRIGAVEGTGVHSMEDLKGKTIGITEPGGGENQIVRGAIAEAGLSTPEDVTLLPIGGAGPQSLSAIQDGKVQAYSSSYPDLASLTASRVVFEDITPEKYSNIPGTCMATTQAFLDSEGGLEKATGLTIAWIDALEFGLANEEETFNMVCDVMPEACTNREAAEILFVEALNVVRPEAGKDPGVVEPENWDTVVEILRANDALRGDLDLTDVISGGDLDEITRKAHE